MNKPAGHGTWQKNLKSRQNQDGGSNHKQSTIFYISNNDSIVRDQLNFLTNPSRMYSWDFHKHITL